MGWNRRTGVEAVRCMGYGMEAVARGGALKKYLRSTLPECPARR